jgi:uncharacterized protein (UPF0332 family)
MLPVEPEAYLIKARDNIAVAEAALAARHYDAVANRAYYAAFQAAVAALWVEGIRPPRDQHGTLSHTAVQGEWAGRLVYRRKRYAPQLRTALTVLYEWRVKGDYRVQHVDTREALRAYNLAALLVQAVEARLTASDSGDAHGHSSN